MAHPLLYGRCPIVECPYVFGITIEVDSEYWEIHLSETEEKRRFVKKRI